MTTDTQTAEKRAAIDVAYDWWKYYSAPTPKGEPSRRGEFAQLRRCKQLEEVMFSTPYQHFFQQVANLGDLSWRDRERVAVVAAILSHVKEEVVADEPSVKRSYEDSPVARYLAKPPKAVSDQALVSDLRFRRLVKVQEHMELFRDMLRIVRLAKGKLPVRDLAESVYWWNDDTRRRWTFSYYKALLELKKPAN